jgi:hypothetical protein
MPATIPGYRRARELSASDGFGLLTALPPQPLRPASSCFCLDATTYWSSTAPSIETPRAIASTLPARSGVRAARDADKISL